MILMAFFVIQKEVAKKFDKYYPKLLNNKQYVKNGYTRA